MRALALLVGVILLAPGACSLVFMGLFVGEGFGPVGRDALAPLGVLWAICLAISAGGVLTIRNAIRGPKRPPAAPPAEG